MASAVPRALRSSVIARIASRRQGAFRPFSVAVSPLQASIRNMQPPPLVPESERREMAVGELEGADFKIEPMRRVGEDETTMRARLIYQSRKRGILESDLLLSTFADENLPHMTKDQMITYDLFLDENDWDIYYWATQDPPEASNTATNTTDTSSASYAGGAEADAAAESAAAPVDEPARKPGEGEWAQTVGTFKPAYRPVPARWRDSEILRLIREHVQKRAADGKGGMAFMPPLRT